MDLKVQFVLIFLLAHKVSLEKYEFLKFSVRNNKNRINELEEQVQEIWDYINSTQVVKASKNNVPKSCKEVLDSGRNISGVYNIQPKNTSQSFMVFCNMELKDGGWTYFLNRFDGSVDFYLDWEDYKKGFGNVNGEFWLGLQHLHELTSDDGKNELLVELVDWNNTKAYAHYSSFAIGSEDEGFSLKVLEGFSGDAGDSLSVTKGMKFSTRDKDQDEGDANCAQLFGGAWWHKNCMAALLTGKYMRETVELDQKNKVMYWYTFRGTQYSLKEARMMVKPKTSS
ncbi:Protein scabrous-like Protein [Tribolium castaneum]|uniref:Protein scabrous-like Protein n=1 Tax=Tribolium castaneum TaxID=7070 RepID=D6WEJ7_TRICA|nr:PREDICTED: fibrinogen C domain-containing protein 1 [Tribolium castaneum]EFA01315.2 Protein scabrous-like Protein [Tribolium castaneum]|eukprot:XP_015833035.1 PREDICTED: fibrinogen C domain-containing protein 1 [Tribolium castaneum]